MLLICLFGVAVSLLAAIHNPLHLFIFLLFRCEWESNFKQRRRRDSTRVESLDNVSGHRSES